MGSATRHRSPAGFWICRLTRAAAPDISNRPRDERARRVLSPLVVDYRGHGVGEASRSGSAARVGEASSRSGRRVIKEQAGRRVIIHAGRRVIKEHASRRVVSDRRRPAPRQLARQPAAVRAPPAVLCVNPGGATPRPAAAEDITGVYKGDCLLYLTYRRAFNQADHPGLTLSRRVGTTPVGDDSGEIVRPARSRSLPGGFRAEGASGHGVQRRGLHQRSSSPGGPPISDNLLEGVTRGLDSDAGMEIIDPNNTENEPKFPQERSENILESFGILSVSEGTRLFVPKINSKLKFPQDGQDIVESFGKLKLSEVKKKFLKTEKNVMRLIESADKDMERQLVASIHSLANDNQAWLEYMELSYPPSESDNSEADPSYEPEHEGTDADMEATQGCDDSDGDSNEDDNDDDDDSKDDEEEDEEEEEEEEEEDEDDDDYDPAQDDDDDDDYINGLALLPPLPPGTEYWNGITVVHLFTSVRNLRPEFHILGFGPNLTIHQRIRLWATGHAMGFDFQPTEMLRYVWRLELLLNGENPGNPVHHVNEPPVPNPGDYDEGWTTDEDMEEEDLGLQNGSSDMDED